MKHLRPLSRNLYILFFFLLLGSTLSGQYIDKAQVEPWGSCPTVCGDGTFRVKLFRVEGQNSVGGTTELSISAGGQDLEITRYSLDNGNTWTNGSFPVNDGTNQTDIVFDVNVPDGLLSVGAHPVQLGLANGFTSNSQFEGDGGCNTLSVEQPGTDTEVEYFSDVWTGYIFDDGGEKACFFDIPYDGTIKIDDLNFSGEFGTGAGNNTNPFPGTFGVDYSASTLTGTYDDFFSVRYTRIEDFQPGMYTFSFNVDDGMRVYVNGDKVLDIWGQNNTTGVQVSDQICLSGPTELLLEYYEWKFEAEIDFSVQKVAELTIPELEYPDICAGASSLPTTNMPAGNFEFANPPTTGTTINAGTGEVTADASDAGESYVVWFTETGGQCSNPIAASVNVIACTSSPAFTIADYCEGSSAPAPETNSEWISGGTWSILPNNGATIDADGIIASGQGGTTYTVTYTYDENGVKSITDDVMVDSEDLAEFSFPAVCEGVEVEPIAGTGFTPGGTYTLTVDPGDGVQVDPTTGSVTGGTATGSPYNVTYTTIGTCPAVGTADVTYNSTGTAVFTFEDWCFDLPQSSTPELEASTSTGGVFSFDPAPTDGATIDPDSGEIENWTMDQVYNVKYSTGGSCPAVGLVQVTTITETIGISYAPFCAGVNSDPAVEEPGFITGGTYRFSVDPADGATIDPTSGVISGAIYATGSYSVEYEVVSNCTGQAITASATANILENVSINIQPENESVCDGTDASFQVNGSPNGVSYQWQVNESNDWVDVENSSTYSGATTYNLLVSAPTSDMTGNLYRAEISNDCGAIYSDVAKLTVNGASIEITGDTLVCAGTPATLFVTEGMDSYTWVSNTTGNQVLSDSSSYSFTPQSLTTLTVFGTALGCEAVNSASVEVVVDPFPDAGPDQEICPGQEVLVGTNTNPSWTYEWYEVGSEELISNQATYSFELDSSIILAVQATTVEGCVRTDTVRVTALSEMLYYIPNAFTPYDGAPNDIFDLKGVGITEYQGLIYNRWGDKLFEWDNTETGWDGTFKEKLVEPEVYIYKFIISSECIKNVQEYGRVTIFQ